MFPFQFVLGTTTDTSIQPDIACTSVSIARHSILTSCCLTISKALLAVALNGDPRKVVNHAVNIEPRSQHSDLRVVTLTGRSVSCWRYQDI